MAIEPPPIKFNIRDDMSFEELRVIVALEGIGPPYTVTRVDGGLSFYETLDAMWADHQKGVWWR